MYAELFEKLRMKKKKLSAYEGIKLQAFNDTITRPEGYIKLMVTLGEGRHTRKVKL